MYVYFQFIIQSLYSTLIDKVFVKNIKVSTFQFIVSTMEFQLGLYYHREAAINVGVHSTYM